MKSDILKIVEDELPIVFDRREQLETWPDGLIVLPGDIDNPLNDPLDEYLSEPNPGWGGEELPDKPHTLDKWDMARDQLRRVHEELSRKFGPSNFPGAPVWSGDPKISPPTDCYAFYLPWHHFTAKTWGIYLLVEGIEALGHELIKFSNGKLKLAQANTAAIVISVTYAAGFFSAWCYLPRPVQMPAIIITETVTDEKIAYYGLTIVPRGYTHQITKYYTDKIEPEPEIRLASAERGKVEAETRMIRQVKQHPVRVAGRRMPCKTGRTRNAQGLCGRWQ